MMTEFHVSRSSRGSDERTQTFETLGEFLAWVKGIQDEHEDWFNGVIVRYDKNLKWEGWELEIYDDCRE